MKYYDNTLKILFKTGNDTLMPPSPRFSHFDDQKLTLEARIDHTSVFSNVNDTKRVATHRYNSYNFFVLKKCPPRQLR